MSEPAIDIQVIELTRPSRPLMCGRRPLSDESLADFIERVIMRLPGKQRRLKFRYAEASFDNRYFEVSTVFAPYVPKIL